ncbi:c-type cytochrome [Azospirillum sp.]|uniref:c-type cytochrome n=1 Tax=Azospirillum sp. TaxID=34012 RepID=UPI002D67538A|nr:c-type cytochrome [Azospirillum sp.]HYD66731.1 c-type cytochrome [Azospirillum sp.]
MKTWMTGAALAATLLSAAPAANAETPLERGRYLMNSVVACGNCHTPQTPAGPVPGQELAGGTPFKDAAFTAYASNITPDPETGIGRWTDEQIITAIREGRRPDGSLIGPPMPTEFYRHISDNDVKALVAYMRTVPPVRNAVPKSEYRMPLPASWGPPIGTVPDVPRTDKLAYGAYLTGALGHCQDCHTPRLPDGRLETARPGAGGQPFPGPWGVSVSRNITSSDKAGLGQWTDAQIKRAITEGIRADGTRLAPPMAFHWYRNIAADDLDAIVAHLRTLPPQE